MKQNHRTYINKLFNKISITYFNSVVFITYSERIFKDYGSYKTIHPDSIAKTYLQFHYQDKSAWSWETQLRTSVEKF